MWVLHLRHTTSGLMSKNVSPTLSKRWNRQSMEPIRLQSFMSAPFSWNSFFHNCPPAKFFILQNKPCKISKLETGN